MTSLTPSEKQYGFPVSLYLAADYSLIVDHMSSTGLGVCAPVHIDLEVWASGFESQMSIAGKDAYDAGSSGYFGRAGMYTTTKFIKQGLDASRTHPTFYAEYWMDYKSNENLIAALNVSFFMNQTNYYTRESTIYCPDGTMGCLNSCSKSYACTLREQQGKECLVIVGANFYDDPAYLQAALSNLDVAAYFCFIGTDAEQELAVESYEKDWPIAFHHWEPDSFHLLNPGKFQRVFLPNEIPERAQLSTGSYGEKGYGQPTTNPVDIDYPTTDIRKYASKLLLEESPDHRRMASLVSRFSFSDLEVDQIINDFIQSGVEDVNERYFRAACDWVKRNYELWSLWLDPLPRCLLSDVNVVCSNVSRVMSDATAISNVTFTWKLPHPEDPALPYTCDGGIVNLIPNGVLTRRPCTFYLSDSSRYGSWLIKKPQCDKYFYNCVLASCGHSTSRDVVCSWLVPDPQDPTQSLQCEGGESLPSRTTIACDYTPVSSSSYILVALVATLFGAVDLVVMVLVYKHRHAPVIAFTQPEMLYVVLVGGLLACVLVFLQGGMHSDQLCRARPALMYVAATTVFGPIVAKMINTYQLAQRRPSRKHYYRTTMTRRSVKILGFFYLGDAVFITTWFVVEPPTAVEVKDYVKTVEYTGNMTRLMCQTGSWTFSWLTVFWGLTIIFASMILSFLNRKNRTDYHESFWLLASNILVVVVALMVLLLDTYGHLPDTGRFFFQTGLDLTAAFVTIGFLFAPKLMQLRTAVAPRSSSVKMLQLPGKLHQLKVDAVRRRSQQLTTMPLGATTPSHNNSEAADASSWVTSGYDESSTSAREHVDGYSTSIRSGSERVQDALRTWQDRASRNSRLLSGTTATVTPHPVMELGDEVEEYDVDDEEQEHDSEQPQAQAPQQGPDRKQTKELRIAQSLHRLLTLRNHKN